MLGITSLAWLTALSVVALVPIDVYSTLARRQTGPLETLWNISYWWGLQEWAERGVAHAHAQGTLC